MTVTLVVTGVGLVLSLAYLTILYKPETNIKSIVKTMPVALFSIAALLAGAPVLLAVGLTLSAIGDWFLSRKGERGFLLGLGAFLMGHVAYILLFWGSTPNLMLSFVLLVFSLGFCWFLWPRAGSLRWPVLAYILVILTMAITASGLDGRNISALYGALFFLASDSVLAVRMFALQPNSHQHRIAALVVWVTYIIAQTLILLTYTI